MSKDLARGCKGYKCIRIYASKEYLSVELWDTVSGRALAMVCVWGEVFGKDALLSHLYCSLVVESMIQSGKTESKVPSE